MSEVLRQLSEGCPLFFLHIPKTAGTSLAEFLIDRFPAGSTYRLTPADPEAKERPAGLDGKRLVIGHADYSFLRHFPRRPIVLTFLRDPVDRAISHFYFFRQVGPEFFASESSTSPFIQVAELDLLPFIRQHPEAARFILGDVHVSLLAPSQGKTADEPLGGVAASLERAEENLAACECVGLYERLEESKELLCRTMDWPTAIPLPRVNKTNHRPTRKDLDAPTRKLLEKMTAVDRELYEFGRTLFARRLKAASAARFLPDALPLPRSTVLTFDQPMPGHGWLQRERTKRGWSRWIQSEAWLEFRLAADSDLRLRFLADPVHLRQCKQLEVEVNGQSLALRFEFTPEGTLFEADVPAALVQQNGGIVTVTFRVPEVLRPRDVVPGCVDFRWLGIAVSKLELGPVQELEGTASRPLFRLGRFCRHQYLGLVKRVRSATDSLVLALRSNRPALDCLEPAHDLAAIPAVQGRGGPAPIRTPTPQESPVQGESIALQPDERAS